MPAKAILFTDVVGSTALKANPHFGADKPSRDRSYQAGVQQPHYKRVSEYVQLRGGTVVNTIGDAFFAIFESPTEALRAAVEIFNSLRNTPIETLPGQRLELYAGLHYGEIQQVDRSGIGLTPDFQGTEVDKTARVQSCAGRGQILLSEVMREITADVDDIPCRLVGHYFLKGLGHARLWDAEWDGSGSARRTRIQPIAPDFDLPPFIDSFIGRNYELQEVGALARDHQAICVQGISGIGKTSLLVQYVLAELRKEEIVDHGFFYFDCAARDMRLSAAAELLFDHIARFLNRIGVTDTHVATVASEQRSLIDRTNALATAIQALPCILFLDNFQEALTPDLRIASPALAEVIANLLQRNLGASHLFLATFERWSPPDRVPIHLHLLPELTPEDSSELLAAAGLTDLSLAARARSVVGGHPQALQWFARLAEDEGMGVAEVIDQLATVDRDCYTEAEFHHRLATQLLDRIKARLRPEAWRLLQGAAIYRHPPSYEALCAAAQMHEASAPILRGARRELLAYFLVKAEALEGPHAVHMLVREYVHGLTRGTADYSSRNLAAAEWWRSAPPSKGEAAAGIERHYHLREAGELEEAGKLQVELVELLRESGKTAWKQGLLEDVLKFDHWFLEHGDNPALTHIHLAQTYRDLLRYTEAEEHYRKAITLAPSNGGFLNGFASFLGKLGRDQEAERFFLLGIELAPDMAHLRAGYAYFLTRRHRFAEGEAQYNKAIELNSGSAYLRYAYGLFLKRRGRSEEAELQFRAGLVLEPDNPRLAAGLGGELLRRGEHEEAEKCFAAALEKWPDNAVLHTEIARVYRKQPGRSRDVERHFLLGLAAAPDDAVLHNEFARWLADAGASAQAEQHFEQAISLAPQRPHPRNSFAKFLRNADRFEEAEMQVRAGIAANPENAELANALAGLLMDMGRDYDAMRAFETALDQHPRSYSLHTAFADFLRRRGDSDRAERELRIALGIEPTLPQAILLLGKLLERRGDLAAAEEVMKKGLRPVYEHIPVYDALGKLLARRRDYDAAEKLFLTGIEIDPRNTRIRNDYIFRVLLKQKRLEEACRNVRIGLQSDRNNPWLLRSLSQINSAGFPCVNEEQHSP